MDSTRQTGLHVPSTSTNLQLDEWPDRCDEATTIWDAGLVLANYLCEGRGGGWSGRLKGRRAVDLGSGTGVVGLAAAALGADVVLTDLPECLPILELNVRQNAAAVAAAGGSACALPLRWGDAAAAEAVLARNSGRPFDVALMGDCMYHTGDAPEALVETLSLLLTSGDGGAEPPTAVPVPPPPCPLGHVGADSAFAPAAAGERAAAAEQHGCGGHQAAARRARACLPRPAARTLPRHAHRAQPQHRDRHALWLWR